MAVFRVSVQVLVANFFPCCCRGNLEKRLATLEGQLKERKGRIKLHKVFIKRKKSILNQLQPKKKRVRRKKKKKCRGHNFHESALVGRGDILDSQVSLGLLASQESILMSQFLLSPAASQVSQLESPLAKTSSPPCLTPMSSLEMSPQTQTSPAPSPPNVFAPRRSKLEVISSPEAGTKWNELCGNIREALAVVVGKHSLSRAEISSVTDSLLSAQHLVQQIRATNKRGHSQAI